MIAKFILEVTRNDGTKKSMEVADALSSWWYYWSCVYFGHIQAAKITEDGKTIKEANQETIKQFKNK